MKRVITSALMLGLLAGCGSQQATVDPSARSRLSADVNDVKTAVNTQDRPTAESALGKLNRDIATAQAQGRLDQKTAGVILAAADRVAEDVRTLTPPPPPPPPPVTEAPPSFDEQSPAEDLEAQIRQRISEQLGKKHDTHGH